MPSLTMVRGIVEGKPTKASPKRRTLFGIWISGMPVTVRCVGTITTGSSGSFEVITTSAS